MNPWAGAAIGVITWGALAFVLAPLVGRWLHARPPVPGDTREPPVAPQPLGQRLPSPAPGLPRRPPPCCPDCGAPESYTIRVWDCDQVRLYGPGGLLTGRTRCLDGELRRLFHDVAFEQRQAGDHPDGF